MKNKWDFASFSRRIFHLISFLIAFSDLSDHVRFVCHLPRTFDYRHTHKGLQSLCVMNTRNVKRNFSCNQSSRTWAKRIFDRFGKHRNISGEVKRAFKLFSMMWELFSFHPTNNSNNNQNVIIFLCCVTVHGYSITRQQSIPSSSAPSLSCSRSHFHCVAFLWVKGS